MPGVLPASRLKSRWSDHQVLRGQGWPHAPTPRHLSTHPFGVALSTEAFSGHSLPQPRAWRLPGPQVTVGGVWKILPLCPTAKEGADVAEMVPDGLWCRELLLQTSEQAVV